MDSSFSLTWELALTCIWGTCHLPICPQASKWCFHPSINHKSLQRSHSSGHTDGSGQSCDPVLLPTFSGLWEKARLKAGICSPRVHWQPPCVNWTWASPSLFSPEAKPSCRTERIAIIISKIPFCLLSQGTKSEKISKFILHSFKQQANR